MNTCIVFLGAPACGKGSYSKRIMEISNFSMKHISSGDELKKDPEMKKKLATGVFAPDLLVLDLIFSVMDRTVEKIVISDGTPRNLFQLGSFYQKMKVDKINFGFVYFEVDKETAIYRMNTRGLGREEDCPEIYERRWDDYLRLTMPEIIEAELLFPNQFLKVDARKPFSEMTKPELEFHIGSIYEFIVRIANGAQ